MCTTVEVGGKSVLNNLLEQDITKTKAKQKQHQKQQDFEQTYKAHRIKLK